tara:strand:+ start:357 stop:620 length:264 start_codon:yes stop_codon:yes gene_type:complete
MSWELKAIEIGSKKLDAQVNIGKNNVEIEAPFFKNFKDTDIVKIDGKSYTINSANNLGNRDEVLQITTNMEKNNEHKQAKSRKATTV